MRTLTYDDIIGYDYESPEYNVIRVRIVHDKVTGQDFICKSRTTQIHQYGGKQWTFLKGFREVWLSENDSFECSEYRYTKIS